MAALLGLDATTRCDVECTLKEVTDRVARFEVAGTIEGPVSDTSARIELRGRYRLDRRSHRIDWFALITSERREISDVADGFRLATRLQTVITPLAQTPELADEKLEGLRLEPTAELSKLTYQSPQGHWQISYDRRWYPTGETPSSATLKLIDRQSLGGQCNVFSLPRRTENGPLGLKDFQADVKQVLGKDFGEFIDAKLSTDNAGRRMLRVVVQGVAHAKPAHGPKAEDEAASADAQAETISAKSAAPGDKPAADATQDGASSPAAQHPAAPSAIPVRWIYYHISDNKGRQVAMTFAVEQRLVERFADADKAIVESVRLK